MPGPTTLDKLLKEVDPLKLARELWPQDVYSLEQQEIVYSVEDNDETDVAAAQMMGKDYIAALIVVLAFIRKTPCRIVTTSAKDDHLKVLWGEINARIDSSLYPLTLDKGGMLVLNDREIKRVVNGNKDRLSYVIGMVASEQSMAAMGGHHIAQTGDRIWRTLLVADECSSVPDAYKKVAGPWANRILAIGNTWPCDNFFKYAFEGKPGTEDKGGDVPRASGKGYHRKTFNLDVECSPNVRFARWEQSQGLEPTDRIVVKGMKPWSEYQKDLANKSWDEEEKSVKLWAKWYKGKSIRLFPKEWLDHAHTLHDLLRGQRRISKAGGCDPGEGSANTAFAAVDEFGITAQESYKTEDTNEIHNLSIAFMQRHKIPPERMCFDRGGGGKQHADRLRAAGYKVRTIAFGEGVAALPTRIRPLLTDRVDVKEERYTFVNRRAQMYGDLSEVMDPSWTWEWIDDNNKTHQASGFAIPRHMFQLRQQLEPIPKNRDGEGRLILPPKNKKDPDSKEVTLVELIGHSPDEADAVVLALHGLLHPVRRLTAMVG